MICVDHVIYISYKLPDFPCSLLTHIRTGRAPKTLYKLCRGEKLAAVQETIHEGDVNTPLTSPI